MNDLPGYIYCLAFDRKHQIVVKVAYAKSVIGVDGRQESALMADRSTFRAGDSCRLNIDQTLTCAISALETIFS